MFAPDQTVTLFLNLDRPDHVAGPDSQVCEPFQFKQPVNQPVLEGIPIEP